ncbi:TonB family protein [Rhizomicrobium electricum]|uniref:TonB C-terminal domain-containing protein n=1 Tax=Rhizomicrobium electricum TaxID=480070 RepID=A0ABN1EL18_9PROT|nr:TonB family protein [Rhizomicrobium electricum]NIJ47069.1 TonB family protein [Rhizomicrobium electricum]
MKSVIALLLLAPATAWAAGNSEQSAPAQKYSPPVATGIPHTCLEYYPPNAMRRGDQGLTTIRFIIKEDGTIRDATVVISSGSDLLDQATLDCAKTWTYRPGTLDGKTVAVSWKVRVEWYMHDTYEGPAPDQAPPPADANWSPPVIAPGSERHGCENSFNEAGDVSIVEPLKPTVVLFTITPEGTTRDPRIETSSGSARYDSLAIGCVLSWRYVPAKRNGAPVGVHWSTTIPWRD